MKAAVLIFVTFSVFALVDSCGTQPQLGPVVPGVKDELQGVGQPAEPVPLPPGVRAV